MKPFSIKLPSIKVKPTGKTGKGKKKKNDMMDGESTEGHHGYDSWALNEMCLDFNNAYI